MDENYKSGLQIYNHAHVTIYKYTMILSAEALPVPQAMICPSLAELNISLVSLLKLSYKFNSKYDYMIYNFLCGVSERMVFNDPQF